MIKLLIIADDFTGGLDTGVQFAARGIRTRVVTDPETDYVAAADGAEVLVVVAETRHMPPFRAYDAVYRVALAGKRLNVPHIYKKTDSGLRGNIGAELSAVMDACGEKQMAFLPSMPAMGRVTRNGVHYIDGQPVSESVFGRDPFEPVTESDVIRLLALQTPVKARSVTWNMMPEGGEGFLIVDAETDEDLRRAGRELAKTGRLRITAGCAGFASVLPELLGLTVGETPRVPKLDYGLFILCGSVNPITRRQLDHAEKNGFTRLHIEPEQKLEAGYFETDAGKAALAGWQNAERDIPWLILDANDAGKDNADTAAYAAKRGMTTEELRSGISSALGVILPEMMNTDTARTMLITGGDTLLQCMDRMKVHQMEPLLEIFRGVVLSRFEAMGQARFVITKSGGFGEETLLSDLKQLIEEQYQHK